MAERLNDAAYTAKVAEILDRLEKVEPTLRRSHRDRFLTGFRNVMAVVALLAFVIAGLAFTKANSVGRTDAEHAQVLAAANKRTVDCINNALGVRAAVGQRDALINGVLKRKPSTLVTDSDANRAVYRALNESQKKPPTPATRKFFYSVLAHAQQVLDANQADRDAHPVGEC